MATSDDAETIRAMIKSENEFANHRLGWMNTINGLLFAGVSFAWGKLNASPIIYLFCALGFLVCLMTFFGVLTAVRSINRQFDWWEHNKPQDYSGPDVIGTPPPKNVLFRYQAPQNYLPLLFLLGWVGMAIIVGRQP
jgi:hypothetical protein